MTYDLDCKKEIKTRAAKALMNLADMNRVWKIKAISLGMKKKSTQDMHFQQFSLSI